VRFENGALGVVHATTAAYPGLSARLHVHGDRGSAIIDDGTLSFIHTTPAGTDPAETLTGSVGDLGNQADRHPEALPLHGAAASSDPRALSDAHRLQYLNFLAALRGEQEIRVTLETNRRSISVIEGVYTSARTGQPVSL